MKRRILLVLTTLVAMLGVFYVYTLVAGLEGLRVSRETVNTVVPPVATNPADDGVGGGPLRGAHDLEIIARDERGRLEGVYRAERWDRRADGAQVLTNPRVEIYQKDGRQMILRADQAEVYGEELNRGVNVRRAKLIGNVTIYFDTSKDPERLPVEQRLDEVVRVHVDEVDFDNEHLTITTDKRVTVFSPRADVYGRGMTISWNQSPRELRLLKIEHGEYMAIYEDPNRLDMLSLPGGESPIATATQPATAPAPKPAAPQAGPSDPTESQPVYVRLGGPTSAASQATTSTAPVEPKPRNQYQAEFHDDVKVVHRNRQLRGAEVLKLNFDWDDSRKEGSNSLLGTSPTKKPASDSTTKPTTRPSRDGIEPMEIYWTGPLVIKPTGRTETPSRDTYDLSAEGRRMVMSDTRATVLCRRFNYKHPQRKGWLEGDPDQPVRLLLSEGAEVACDRIDFTQRTGKALLRGAGHMARRFDKDITQAQAIELIETDDPKLLPAGERITWNKNVELTFADEKVRRKDGSISTRQLIKQADFHGQVVLQQSEDPNGDMVECDDLTVTMARGKVVSAYPKTALAVGNVKARQEGSNVSAGKVTVTFIEVDKSQPGSSSGNEGPFATGGSIRPATFIAEGGVVITNRRDPNADPLQAVAERMESRLIENNFARRTAVLSGTAAKPARVSQGPNRLVGEIIRLDQSDDSAFVDGAGTLDFITTKDTNGNILPEPRPVQVTWSKRMSFRGAKRTAEFAGDVAMDSALDNVRCQNLQLLFTEQLPDPNSPAAGVAKGAKPDASRRGGMAVGMEQYSRRRISMIFADRDIVLRSRREDQKNRLLRRMQLTGEKLIYDGDSGRITMLGRGTLINEDYGKPRSRRIANANGLMAGVDRPSQSAFEWKKNMQLSQTDRLVTLEGSVTMVHRSGDQVVLTNRLNVPRDQWGTLPAGRKTILKCENMMAKFGLPEDKASAQPSTRPSVRTAGDPLREGPTLGPLDLFSATGDVNLKDTPRQVLAQRLIYNRLTNLVVVWGFLEGKVPSKATIIYEDPQAGRSQAWSSPKLIWYREDNRILAEDVSGTGGR